MQESRYDVQRSVGSAVTGGHYRCIAGGYAISMLDNQGNTLVQLVETPSMPPYLAMRRCSYVEGTCYKLTDRQKISEIKEPR